MCLRSLGAGRGGARFLRPPLWRDGAYPAYPWALGQVHIYRVPCDTRWASYISSTVSMLRVWAHARDAVSQLLERQKDRSPPWAVTLSQLLQDNSLLLRLSVVAVVGESFLVPELMWASKDDGLHAFELYRHTQDVLARLETWDTLPLLACLHSQLQLTPAGTTPELAVPAGAPPQQQQQLAAASTSRKREAPAASKLRAAKQGLQQQLQPPPALPSAPLTSPGLQQVQTAAVCHLMPCVISLERSCSHWGCMAARYSDLLMRVIKADVELGRRCQASWSALFQLAARELMGGEFTLSPDMVRGTKAMEVKWLE
ncbi:hypothetical protein QJQ45_027214, partial [Haematococcus lacustris]